MNMRTGAMKAISSSTVAALLLLAACSSEADTALENAESDAPGEAVSSTTTEVLSAPATEPVAGVAETEPAAPVNGETDPDTDEIAFVIESEVNFGAAKDRVGTRRPQAPSSSTRVLNNWVAALARSWRRQATKGPAFRSHATMEIERATSRSFGR